MVQKLNELFYDFNAENTIIIVGGDKEIKPHNGVRNHKRIWLCKSRSVR